MVLRCVPTPRGQSRWLKNQQPGVAIVAQTVLPESEMSTPQSSANASTMCSPRPCVSWSPLGSNLGASQLPSRTSSRIEPWTTPRARTPGDAWTIEFETSSLVNRTALSIVLAGHACKMSATNSRHAATAPGSMVKPIDNTISSAHSLQARVG